MQLVSHVTVQCAVKIGVVKTAQTFGILGAKSGFSGVATSELGVSRQLEALNSFTSEMVRHPGVDRERPAA